MLIKEINILVTNIFYPREIIKAINGLTSGQVLRPNKFGSDQVVSFLNFRIAGIRLWTV